MQSRNYERAKAMVLSDKFNYRQSEFFDELSRLLSRYMDYDSLTVTALDNANSMVISVSVKKVKPIYRPQS